MALPSLTDTIAAIATPPGKGAIGIVRLSGKESLEVAQRIWKGKSPLLLTGNQFTHGQIINPETSELVDDSLMLVFRNPHSYTGQDSVEFHTHGSPAVLRSVMNLVLAQGARPAGPGEFTLRAYLNNKMDLAQAESVLGLIESESDAARRQAMRGLNHDLSNKIGAMSEKLLTLLSHIQAWLDYPEEGVEEAVIYETVGGVQAEVIKLLSTAHAGKLATKGARIALIGAPNVGKSSLLNALLGYERAIVAPIAGTTRDYLEAPMEIFGIPIVAIDTAGLRDTDDAIESSGVERAIAIAQEADITLYLADSTEPKPVHDSKIDDRRILVATKSDLNAAWKDSAYISISNKTLEGMDLLRQEIKTRLLGKAPEGEIWISNERHIAALETAYQHLSEAMTAPEDLAGVSIEAALDALAEITGKDVSEEVVDRVFRNFCVGK